MSVRAAVLQDVGKISIEEFPVPVHVGPDEALMKVEMVGVCGSDFAVYKGKMKVRMPLIMGHEPVGHIVAIGRRAAERYGVGIGDRVITEFTIPCNACYECRIGNYRFCKKLKAYGSFVPSTEPPHLWGAYAEHMYIAPNSGVHRVSDSLPAEAAVLICAVVGNALQWVQNLGGLKVGGTIVIEGAGPQGLAAVVAARECGASRIVVTGLLRDALRLEFARRLGADIAIDVETNDAVEVVREITHGRMADLVLDVTGSEDGIVASLDLVRKQGTVVIAGMTGNKVIPLVVEKIVAKEIRFQGAFSHDIRAVKPALEIVESRRYPLEEMVTHRYALKDLETALRVSGGEVVGENPMKVVITPWAAA